MCKKLMWDFWVEYNDTTPLLFLCLSCSRFKNTLQLSSFSFLQFTYHFATQLSTNKQMCQAVHNHAVAEMKAGICFAHPSAAHISYWSWHTQALFLLIASSKSSSKNYFSLFVVSFYLCYKLCRLKAVICFLPRKGKTLGYPVLSSL